MNSQAAVNHVAHATKEDLSDFIADHAHQAAKTVGLVQDALIGLQTSIRDGDKKRRLRAAEKLTAAIGLLTTSGAVIAWVAKEAP